MSVTTSVAAWLAGSWQYWQNRETVTLVLSTGQETPAEAVVGTDGNPGEQPPDPVVLDAEYTIQECKRFDVNQRDVPTIKTGGYTSFDLVWILPKAKMPTGVAPKPGDIIRDAESVEYTVLDSFQNGWKTWYRLNTRNLTLAYGLSDTLEFSRPIYSNAGGTKRVSSYATLASGIPGKVLETGGSYESDLLGKRQFRDSIEIHSSRWVDLYPGDRITDQNGNIFQVTVVGIPYQLDMLTQYTCERIH